MKANLIFDLCIDKDRRSFELASKAEEAHKVIDDVMMSISNAISIMSKSDDSSLDVKAAHYAEIYDMLRDTCREYGI